MRLHNTRSAWGWLSITFHWLTAVAVFGLFGVGVWMVDLTYYDDWYHRAPHWHKSIGILLLILVTLRLGWRLLNPVPQPAAGVSRFEHLAASVVHGVLYALLLAIMLAGYLIATADGDAIDVFGLFSVPASLTNLDLLGMAQEDLAGIIHETLAWSLMVLVGLHAAGALKHHLIDRDATLQRMLGVNRGRFRSVHDNKE